MTITIDGTTGIAGVDGSAGTPAVQGADTNTGIFFGTDTVTISTGGTAAVTVDSGQRTKFPTTIGVGGATPSTSGSGVSFPATASASTDANTLDDYEEGTWTPVIGGDGGESGQSYSRQVGTYTKVGNLVCATFSVVLSAKGTITGFAVIKGLPFASNSTANAVSGSSIGYFASLAVNSTWVGFQLSANATIFYLETTTAAQATVTDMTTTNIGNTTRFDGTIVYRTA
jgi:hypothetical protein